MRSEWVKSTLGHRFHYTTIGTVAPEGNRIFIKDKSGHLLAVINTESVDEEVDHLYKQMDDIESTRMAPSKKHS